MSQLSNLHKHTNFMKVHDFNTAFDMIPKNINNIPCDNKYVNSVIYCNNRIWLFDTNPRIIKLRLDLINEEINELNHAINTNDFVETRDALADILYVVYGMADILGINIDYYFRERVLGDIGYLGDKILTQFIEFLVGDAYNIQNTIHILTSLVSGKIYYTNYDYVRTLLNFKFPEDIASTPLVIMKIVGVDIGMQKSVILDNINTIYKQLEVYCLSAQKDSISLEMLIDYIFKLLKNVYIYSYISGINADSDFAIVHDSNMSKLCDNETDAQATVTDYMEKYKSGSSPYDSPYYYELPELGKWIVKNKSTGKALKNIKYKKVDFSTIIY